ncbi:MAG: hypothetical protein JWN04_6580, partial [Myxococcaceae bacterium]|nr:hypothetical protein [Myxococcaceae bacterium]
MFGSLQTRHSQRGAIVRVWVSLCGAIPGAVPTHAQALEPTFARAPEAQLELALPELHWSAPPECPDAEHVRQRVASLLAGSAAASAASAVRAAAVVTHHRSGYKLALTVKSAAASGLRTLRGADCSELSETAAWLIAVTIDPDVPAVPSEAAV